MKFSFLFAQEFLWSCLYFFFPISHGYFVLMFFLGWGVFFVLPPFSSTIVARKPRNCSARCLSVFFSFSFYHYSIINQFARKRLRNRTQWKPNNKTSIRLTHLFCYLIPNFTFSSNWPYLKLRRFAIYYYYPHYVKICWRRGLPLLREYLGVSCKICTKRLLRLTGCSWITESGHFNYQ